MADNLTRHRFELKPVILDCVFNFSSVPLTFVFVSYFKHVSMFCFCVVGSLSSMYSCFGLVSRVGIRSYLTFV